MGSYRFQRGEFLGKFGSGRLPFPKYNIPEEEKLPQHNYSSNDPMPIVEVWFDYNTLGYKKKQ